MILSSCNFLEIIKLGDPNIIGLNLYVFEFVLRRLGSDSLLEFTKAKRPYDASV